MTSDGSIPWSAATYFATSSASASLPAGQSRCRSRARLACRDGGRVPPLGPRRQASRRARPPAGAASRPRRPTRSRRTRARAARSRHDSRSASARSVMCQSGTSIGSHESQRHVGVRDDERPRLLAVHAARRAAARAPARSRPRAPAPRTRRRTRRRRAGAHAVVERVAHRAARVQVDEQVRDEHEQHERPRHRDHVLDRREPALARGRGRSQRAGRASSSRCRRRASAAGPRSRRARARRARRCRAARPSSCPPRTFARGAVRAVSAAASFTFLGWYVRSVAHSPVSEHDRGQRRGDEEQHDRSEDPDRRHEHRGAAAHRVLVQLLAARVANVLAQREQSAGEIDAPLDARREQLVRPRRARLRA